MSKTSLEEAAAEELAALSAEIARLRADLGGLVETVGRSGREHAEAIAGSVKASGKAALADFEGKLHELEHEITASARRSPWRALGIAVGIGFLAGFILRR